MKNDFCSTHDRGVGVSVYQLQLRVGTFRLVQAKHLLQFCLGKIPFDGALTVLLVGGNGGVPQTPLEDLHIC